MILKEGEDVSLSSVGRPHQTATIAAGQEGRVFYLQIPSGFIGFLYQYANNWFTNTYYRLSIDGEELEDGKIERQIAPLNNPMTIMPPYVAKKSIEVIAVNNSNESQDFEWLINGKIYRDVD